MFADAGALQIDKDVKMHNETIHKHKLGKFSEAEVMAGSEWPVILCNTASCSCCFNY
jgi:hypothetical protein